MGEAGLGKSRLVTELHQSLSAAGQIIENNITSVNKQDESSPAQLSWHEGRSLSYETSTPYAPFVDLLTSCFSLQVEQTDPDKYIQIKDQIAQLFPQRTAEIAPFMATLLGVQPSDEDFERVRYLEPPQLRQRIFSATIEFVEQLAASQPLVLVFDDIHWIDPTSLDLLEQLLTLTERVSLMIVALFRLRRDDLSWNFHERATQEFSHRYTSITLTPLDNHHSRELVGNLLHVEGFPEKVRALILKKAEGNPFYIEEIIRSLMDAGLVIRENSRWLVPQSIEDIAVPDTLVGVITTRLDGLDEKTRDVAHAAAVIGRQFEYHTLAAVYGNRQVLDLALTELQQRELIREKSRTPQRIYLFKHALTQETAYASLLKRNRQRMHLRVAEYLENKNTGRASDIARHFMEAKQAERALPYLIDAGTRANHASSTSEAIQLFTQALDISNQAGDVLTLKKAYEGLGSALTFSGDIPGAIKIYQTMLQTGRDQRDEAMQISAHNKLGFVNGILLEEFQTAETHLDHAEQLARQSQNNDGLAELHMMKCVVCTVTGDLDGAIEHLGESVQLGRDLDAEEPLLFGLTHSANTLTYLARFEEAWNAAQEAYRKAEQLGNRRYLSDLQTFAIAYHHICAGDLTAARQSGQEGLALAAKIGYAIGLWQGNYVLGQIAQLQGDYQRALNHLHTALKIAETEGMAHPMMMPLSILGTIYIEISEKFYDQATDYHNQVIALAEQPSGAAWGSSAWVEMGFCYLAVGEIERAEEYFLKGLTIPTTTMNLLHPRLLVGAANVALAKADFDQAAKLAHDARTYADERGMQDQYPLIVFTHAKILSARGSLDQALEQFNLAEALAQKMNMRPLVWKARAAAGQVLSDTGRSGEADLKRRQAQVVIEEIGTLIEDESLRSKFLESAYQKTWGTVRDNVR
jgi:predicted ATPase